MSWILFSILAAVTWAIVNTVDKYILTKLTKNPYVVTITLGVIGAIVSLFVYFINGFSELSNFNIFLAAIAGLFYILMNICYIKAVQLEEVSRIVPLFFLSPLFILLFAALFLGEVFTPLKYLGIFLLVIGAILISFRRTARFNSRKAIWFMIFAALFISINQVITKHLLSFADFWTVFSYVRIGAVIAMIPVVYLNFSDLMATVKKHGKKVVGILTVNESLNVLGVIFVTFAVSTGYVTLVNALTSIQPFFVLLFAFVLSVFYPKILKEGVGKSAVMLKLIAIVLMFIGALLIS